MNLETHDLQIAEENGDLRVLAGGQSYLMKRIKREDFLKQYREAWERARLDFAPIATETETRNFTRARRLFNDGPHLL
jgi:hypothetical protein